MKILICKKEKGGGGVGYFTYKFKFTLISFLSLLINFIQAPLKVGVGQLPDNSIFEM